ncbi:MAG: pilus assembly protein N-terminal domain-containing protein [Acidobacteriota bacterium]|nr:pilus assembly protein N-terminal domain-containing protein [Acidobacteriota bacterium]
MTGAAVDNSPRAQGGAAGGPEKLMLTVGKSMIIDSPVRIERLAVANEALVEAVAIDPRQVLINGKAAGETSLIVWQQGGARLVYDLTVRISPMKLEAVRQELAREFPSENINVTFENDTAFVRGTVKDVTASDRVMSIVATLGKAVNLLRVDVPPADTQILLKVRFANVDRAATTDLGMNLLSNAFNQTSSITTGQYSPPIPGGTFASPFTVSDALNILMFRNDINVGATIRALESKRLLETLAEPNVLTTDGKAADFVAGGEFPFPMVQGGASVGAVTIQFREFGIKIKFLPKITPRGTIHLQVAPEVSALDYANAVSFQGFTIPALSTRRVQTEVELEGGQSFVIAGLLDQRMTETLNKIPGLANIPLLGKLFTSRAAAKNNSELMVIVTPEIVRPIPASQKIPELVYPQPFMEHSTKIPMETPGMDQTGPVPVKAPRESMPVEELVNQRKEGQAAPTATMPPYMLMPVQPGQTAAPAGSSSPPKPDGGGN